MSVKPIDKQAQNPLLSLTSIVGGASTYSVLLPSHGALLFFTLLFLSLTQDFLIPLAIHSSPFSCTPSILSSLYFPITSSLLPPLSFCFPLQLLLPPSLPSLLLPFSSSDAVLSKAKQRVEEFQKPVIPVTSCLQCVNMSKTQ